MRFPALLVVLCLILAGCQQQEGCTNPFAENYDAGAVEEDGSCVGVAMDNHVYSTVQIGDQTWFAENLRTTVYANGDIIQASLSQSQWESTTEGATAVYGEGMGSCAHTSPDMDACDELQALAAYGRLYNGYAVLDARGLCPTGWHVPNHEDWMELTDYLSSQGFEGSEGLALKSTSGWTDDGHGPDTFGFSAVPGGQRGTAGAFDFDGAGYLVSFWSSSHMDSTLLHKRQWVAEYDFIFDGGLPPNFGSSVRCIQDAD